MSDIRMTEEEFFDEIYTMLGDSMVDVELSERDLRVAFNRAKRTYKQMGPNNQSQGYFCVPVKKGVQEYHVPAEINTIVKVIRPTLAWNVDDPMAMAAYNALFFHHPSSIGTGDFITMEYMYQNLEIWRRYTAHDVDFHHNPRMGIVRFLQVPKVDEQWYLECYSDSPDDIYRGVLWVQNWTLAEAKKILGGAYRKMGGVAGPDGSTMNIGGDQLIQEAQEEMRLLLEDIQNGVAGETEWWGISVG